MGNTWLAGWGRRIARVTISLPVLHHHHHSLSIWVEDTFFSSFLTRSIHLFFSLPNTLARDVCRNHDIIWDVRTFRKGRQRLSWGKDDGTLSPFTSRLSPVLSSVHYRILFQLEKKRQLITLESLWQWMSKRKSRSSSLVFHWSSSFRITMMIVKASHYRKLCVQLRVRLRMNDQDSPSHSGIENHT